MPRQLTVRGVDDELAERIAHMARQAGVSVNAMLLRILEGAAGIEPRRRRLERYATWTEQDGAEFDEALDRQRVLDDSLWR